jgi:hypothetical protein
VGHTVLGFMEAHRFSLAHGRSSLASQPTDH